MTREYCDICGCLITEDDRVNIKIKKRFWFLYGWSAWENLLVHRSCWRDICKIIEQKRKLEKTN